MRLWLHTNVRPSIVSSECCGHFGRLACRRFTLPGMRKFSPILRRKFMTSTVHCVAATELLCGRLSLRCTIRVFVRGAARPPLRRILEGLRRGALTTQSSAQEETMWRWRTAKVGLAHEMTSVLRTDVYLSAETAFTSRPVCGSKSPMKSGAPDSHRLPLKPRSLLLYNSTH